VVVLWFLCGLELRRRRTARLSSQQEFKPAPEDYQKKLTQAVNLDALRKQREQVQQYVTQLEKQLPSKAEMDALLSDINQAGLGRSLHVRPLQAGTGEREGVLRRTADLGEGHRPVPRHRGSFAADIAQSVADRHPEQPDVNQAKEGNADHGQRRPRPSATSIPRK
jgi:type IV pilus assembly protein PilO